MREMAWRCGWGMIALLSVAACGQKGDTVNHSAVPSLPGRLSVVTGGAGKVRTDSDIAAKGTGLPEGYLAQADMPNASIADVSYRADGNGRWEVRTGPAHILYALKDVTRNIYSVTATIEQLEKSAHPEAYGVFIGGSALDVPAKRRYTYFLVRGDGKYMVKVRDGMQTRTVTDWTAHPAVPQEDAAGKVVYGIRIDVDGKAAKVSVNGKPVTTILAKSGPLEGVVGTRINHNLHLMVTPVSVIQTK
jgi:hypothetical protein